MGGNAVEVAIALWHAPGRRSALRQRPLPDDVGVVIELAGGAAKRLTEWSARTGEPIGRLQEAAQFYLREILLFDGADAYRMLGVSPDADARQIKAHHRALLQWLHPDRRGNDPESVYAVGINAAWTQLSSSDRRAAYDRQGQARAGRAPVRVWVAAWHGDPTRPASWPAWLALGIAAALGLWLAVLLDRKADASAPDWHLSVKDAAGQRPAVAAPVRATTGTDPVVTTLAARAKVAGVQVVDQSGDRSRSAVASIGEAVSVAPPGMRLAQVGQAAPAPGHTRSDDTGPAAARLDSVVPSSRTNVVSVPGDPVVEVPAPAPLPVIDSNRAIRAASVGREVMRYLASDSNHVPPVWRNVAAQDAAASIRERFGNPSPHPDNREHAQFGAPVWNIGPDRGTMRSRITSGGNDTEATVRVDMSWRDDRWLVDAVGMETAQ